jgi:hypothetical protein
MKARDKKIPNHKSIENRILNSFFTQLVRIRSLGKSWAPYMELDPNPNVELDILDKVFTLK